jgi:hypothetical protein
MRTLLLLLACLVSPAHAVGFSFSNVPIPLFSETVLHEILGRDYILSPAVLGMEGGISMTVRDIREEEALSILRHVLRSQGVDIQELPGGVLYLDALGSAPGGDDLLPGQPPVAQGPESVAVYRPRFRSVDFLRSAIELTGVKTQGSGDVLVYGGTLDQTGKAREILSAVDVSLASVNVRAALLEVTESEDSSRSLSSALSLLSGKVGIQFQAGTELQNFIRFKNTNLGVILSALEGDSRFRYVAEPSLGVLNGQEARLVVGSDEPVRGGPANAKLRLMCLFLKLQEQNHEEQSRNKECHKQGYLSHSMARKPDKRNECTNRQFNGISGKRRKHDEQIIG